MYNFAVRLLLLCAGHALCDYALQGQYMSDSKNPEAGGDWWLALLGHATIHAAMVFLITRSLLCAGLELGIHMVTDFAKCERVIGSRTDQLIHYACKVLWAVV